MQRYLIMKRDLYYRPNDCGYTGIKDHAGRYTLEEVAARFPNMDSPHQDGTSFITEEDAPEFTSACFWDYKLEHITKKRDEAQAEIARLTAEVERLKQQQKDDWENINLKADVIERWINTSAAQHQEIAELKAEVELMQTEGAKMFSLGYNTSWNDAIEAAESIGNKSVNDGGLAKSMAFFADVADYKIYKQGVHDYMLAIRSLRRPT